MYRYAMTNVMTYGALLTVSVLFWWSVITLLQV